MMYEYDKYLDDPDEVYSRLMQIRYLNNLDPRHVYTLDEIKKMRKDGLLTLPDSQGLERYSDKFIQHLFNDVAYNGNGDDGVNMAAHGGYVENGEYDLTKEQIDDLIKQGYEIEYI